MAATVGHRVPRGCRHAPPRRSEPRARLLQELDFLGRRRAAERFVAGREAAEALDDHRVLVRTFEQPGQRRLVVAQQQVMGSVALGERWHMDSGRRECAEILDEATA